MRFRTTTAIPVLVSYPLTHHSTSTSSKFYYNIYTTFCIVFLLFCLLLISNRIIPTHLAMSSTQLPPFLAYIAQFNILICYEYGHALFSKDPLTHIREHDPTIRDNHPMLGDIRRVLGKLRPIEDAYQAIRLASPVLPLIGLPQPTLGFQCCYNNCLAIFSGQAQAIKHLRDIHRVFAASRDPREHLRSCYYQGLQKNRYFFAVLDVAHSPTPQAPNPQGPTPQAPNP